MLASRRAFAISPKARRAAKAGKGNIVGRERTFPKVLVNSRLVTGWGATALTAPRIVSLEIAC